MFKESAFINDRGITIATYEALPRQEAKAGILLVHGYAEHTGRYRHVIRELNDTGLAVYALDHQGHGKSGGVRCYIKEFDYYVDDLSFYFEKLRNETGLKKWFILGHSMGGAIALKMVLRHQNDLNGMLLTGPMLEISTKVPKVVQEMAKYVAAMASTVPVVKLETEAISRDPDVVRNYLNDPLVYTGRVRAKMAVHFSKINTEMPGLFSKIELPLWVGHGTLDRITSPEGSKMLYRLAQSQDKTLKLFDGLFHEIMNEPEKDMVLGEISFWIKRHLEAGGKHITSQQA
ncbi:MAG: alpha/beta hydrolase [Balneolaceae bacterium]|nr:MAG: alpha/beta hydrolase [Balneolaceae bacterium]